MDIVSFSQVIFNFVAALGIIIVTFLLCLLIYYVVKIFIEVKKAAQKVNAGFERMQSNVEHLKDFIISVPFISKLKGRKNRDKNQNNNE